jgi:hypothetical protein
VRAQQVVVVLFTVLMVVVVAFGAVAYLGRKHDSTASVSVYSRGGGELWHQSLDDGYAVVVAATSSAVLVGETNDCQGDGPAELTLVTPGKTAQVAASQACQVMRFQGPAARVRKRIVAGRLVVTIPSTLGNGTVSLPCPCGGGARAVVKLGTFVAGAD